MTQRSSSSSTYGTSKKKKKKIPKKNFEEYAVQRVRCISQFHYHTFIMLSYGEI